MSETPEGFEQVEVDPSLVRYLKLLVTALAGVMIVGLVAVIALLVIRLQADVPPLPSRITLPEGTKAQAFTQGESWFAVVTEDERILIFARDGATLLQEIKLSTGE
ncbi:DUF6476 family protein [Lentibacter sp. XHP0401]|jgi:Family of unknown function (DUF6476)|uniref:DUF6476 family protein n=1 Tax=Lentibacter sp. XHP0401 TaxID=2984334 RepID=UPI0021E7C3A3|nr:DUF6476 family protein [Lentibacter sp. XHP0401]MCV2892952.1 DUF6476 family protein [Lentibacter sp. XHP0401]